MRQQDSFDRRQFLLFSGSIAASLLLQLPGANPVLAAKNKSTSKNHKKNASGKKSSKNKKGTSQSGGGTGAAIVKEARKYKGAKYVWAGASPKGFDCSGLTWYVYNQVTGDDIGRTVKEQFKKGSSASRGSLQPGDIVFFKNTYKNGLSHCGIFISGSDFIHAENENTGVVISSLDSDYYSDRYAGARRLV